MCAYKHVPHTQQKCEIVPAYIWCHICLKCACAHLPMPVGCVRMSALVCWSCMPCFLVHARCVSLYGCAHACMCKLICKCHLGAMAFRLLHIVRCLF